MEWLIMLALGFVAGVLYARQECQPSRAEQAAVRARLREEAQPDPPVRSQSSGGA